MTFTPSYNYNILDENNFFSEMNEIVTQLNNHDNTGYFESFDNKNIYYEFFKVKNPVANIIIVHGYTEFTKKYYELTWYFMQMGYNVFLYDARCHGNSQRYNDDIELVHVESYDEYVSDLNMYIKQIVTPNSDNAPLYIYAHSMGGSIAQLYLNQYENKIEKALLSAPMVYPFTPPLPRFMLKYLLTKESKKFGWDAIFKFSSKFNPEVTMQKSNDSSLPRFEYNLKLRIDNLNYRNSYGSNRWNFEAISVVDKLLNKRCRNNTNCKTMVIIAGKDTAVNPKHQKKLVKHLNCQCKIYEDSKHSLYTQSNDKLREYVNDVLDFFAN